MKFLWLALLTGISTEACDLTALLSDRQAVERVYHAHRTGAKLPFQEAIRLEDLQRMVEVDLLKEEALKLVYRTEIGANDVQAEVDRINRTTRAPEVLAELKAALGNDPVRFARAVVKPLLVDRKLREAFENDPGLHVEQRKTVEAVRAGLLNARRGKDGVPGQLRLLQSVGQGEVTQTTWRLATRETGAEPLSKSQSLRNFDELSPELRPVLIAQLRAPGDVSAVIEAPSEFRLYLAQDLDEATLSTACLAVPKQGFEQWLQSFGRKAKNESHESNSAN
jgi:hypothetical protein